MKRQSIWDKVSITELFGHPPPLAATAKQHFLKPALFVGALRNLSVSERDLSAHIFATLGFTLSIFRVKMEPLRTWEPAEEKKAKRDQAELRDWLKPFFTIHDHLDVGQSALARYCISIIGVDDTTSRRRGTDLTFPDLLERQYAHLLRLAIGKKVYDGDLLNESDFYGAVLNRLTHNIENIVTIPHRVQRLLMRRGYKVRRAKGDLSKKTVHESTRLPEESDHTTDQGMENLRNKFVVLRRWQSFNPRIPYPASARVRGGGCFLLWNGKGFVIDPGYDFIQNLYDEGFSLEDIDAVIMTHSHPDHDGDFSTLTTLIREWNEHHWLMGSGDNKEKKLDLFLNESTHLKFSSWLKASKEGVRKIVSLPLVVWASNSEDSQERIRGENVVIDLRKAYRLKVEVVPAWHDDVIGRTAAIGLKFHLYSSKGRLRKVGTLGYTGDTGAYGEPPSKSTRPRSQLCIEKQYEDCDVLIAHLGDVRLRELASRVKHLGKNEKLESEKLKSEELGNCINRLLSDWFCSDKNGKQLDTDRLTKRGVEEFLRLLVTLNLAPVGALSATLDEKAYGGATVSAALNQFIATGRLGRAGELELKDVGKTLRELCQGDDEDHADFDIALSKHLKTVTPGSSKSGSGSARALDDAQVVYLLLGFLCASSLIKWSYKYHLGISGLFRLHQAMIKKNKDGKRCRLFVVAELPEELASYRHYVARLLNVTQANIQAATNSAEEILGRREVHALTGDIGLHISLTDPITDLPPTRLEPKIRCVFCNYNNETVLNHKNYHSPNKMLETPIKRLDSAMIYLCTEHDHHVECEERPRDFLSRPDLRVI